MRERAISRGTEAGSATYAMAYRSGQDIVDERTGELKKYGWRWDIKAQGLHVPSQYAGNSELDWARNLHTLSNAMEFGELNSRRARVAREYTMVLPREMTDEQRLKLVSGFAQALSDRHQNAVHFGIHEPRKGRAYTHHVHLIASTRKVTLDGLTEKIDAERNPDRLKAFREVRGLWQEHLKAAMKEAGLKYSIDRLDYNGRKPHGFNAEQDGDSYADYRKRLEDEGFDINRQRREDTARSSLTPEEKLDQRRRKIAIRVQEKAGGGNGKQKHAQRALAWFHKHVPSQKALPPQRSSSENDELWKSKQRAVRATLKSKADIAAGGAGGGGRDATGMQALRRWMQHRERTAEQTAHQRPEDRSLRSLHNWMASQKASSENRKGKGEDRPFETSLRRWMASQKAAEQKAAEQKAATDAPQDRFSNSLKNWMAAREASANAERSRSSAPSSDPQAPRSIAEVVKERSLQVWMAYRDGDERIRAAIARQRQHDRESKLARENKVASRQHDRGYGLQLSYGHEI